MRGAAGRADPFTLRDAMSGWDHLLCAWCWFKRERTHAKGGLRGRCCVCGVDTDTGSALRAHPASLKCNGVHLDRKGPLVGQ